MLELRRLKSSLVHYMIASRRRGDGKKIALCAVTFGYCRLATTQEMQNS